MRYVRLLYIVISSLLFASNLSNSMWQDKSEMTADSPIYVAGHKGLVGSAIIRKLQSQGYKNIITRTMEELDLRDQRAVNAFFEQEKPSYVFLAAARVGGIKANSSRPAEFIYDNLAITMNIIHAAYVNHVKKLLFLGSSCIYPRLCPQPIQEKSLLTGPLEETNEPYAIAKIAGIKLCQAYNKQYGTKFIACMPCNLYGPYDNFDLTSSHVLPALIAKVYQAKKTGSEKVTVWGTGKPFREFLYVEDLADAVSFLMHHYNGSDIVNVGSGREVRIAELASIIKDALGFKGRLEFDPSYPDGTPRKVVDVSVLREHGWEAPTDLVTGIRTTVAWYLEQQERQ